MYASGYNKLFWGMIFIIFNFNLGSINILPDFVGYLLIYSGLNNLVSQHVIYNRGRIPAIILTVLTLKDIINLGNVNLLDNTSQISFITMIFGFITTMISLYLIYIICSGIYLLAEERSLMDLKESTGGRYKAYLVNTIILQFLLSFSMNMPNEFKIIIIIFVVINIIALLSIAGLFRRARIELGEELN